MKTSRSILPALFLSLIIIGEFVLVFFQISSRSFDLDESFSVYVSQTLPRMATTLWNSEANMSLYYFLLHFWQVFGTEELAIRSFSAIFSVIASLFVYKITSQLFSKKTAFISLILLSLNLFFIFYAQEARSYSLTLFLTVLSYYAFLKFDQRLLYKIIYLLSASLALYSHFYAFLILAAQMLAALLTHKLRRYLPFFLIILLSSFPILLSPSFRSHQVDWIQRPSLASIAGTIFAFCGDFPVLVIIYGILSLFSLSLIIKSLYSFRYRVLLTWLAVPIILAFSVSLFLKPIYQTVYFLPCLPPFIILTADWLVNLKANWLRKLLFISLLLFSGVRLYFWYTQNSQFYWIFNNQSEGWKEAATYVEQNIQPGDAIIFFGYFNRLPFSFYQQYTFNQVVEIASSTYNLGGGDELPSPNLDRIANFSFPRVFFITNPQDTQILNRQSQYDAIRDTLLTKYHFASRVNFSDIYINLYD